MNSPAEITRVTFALNVPGYPSTNTFNWWHFDATGIDVVQLGGEVRKEAVANVVKGSRSRQIAFLVVKRRTQRPQDRRR